jgi:hypothetical protein
VERDSSSYFSICLGPARGQVKVDGCPDLGTTRGSLCSGGMLLDAMNLTSDPYSQNASRHMLKVNLSVCSHASLALSLQEKG